MIKTKKYRVIKKLKKIGFKNFELLSENEVPLDMESDFQYMIDVLPFRLEIEDEQYYKCTISDEIPRTSFNDLEDFYRSKKEMEQLNQKKIRLIYKMAYYYELREIIVYISFRGINFTRNAAAEERQDFYMSIDPMYAMQNLKKFLTLVRKTMYTSSIHFCFTNGVTVEFDFRELYTGILCNKNISNEIIENISILSNSEGLFLI